MSATDFQLYNKGKRYIGDGTIRLGVTPLRIVFFKSGSNASTFTLSTLASITNQVSATGGYVTGGRALAGLLWSTGASAKQMKFDADDLTLTASGADINHVKYAVICDDLSTNKLLAWCRLSSAQFNVPTGYGALIRFSSQGIFSLT